MTDIEKAFLECYNALSHTTSIVNQVNGPLTANYTRATLKAYDSLAKELFEKQKRERREKRATA